MNISLIVITALAYLIQLDTVKCDSTYGTKVFRICSKACGESVSNGRNEDLLSCQNECQSSLINLLIEEKPDQVSSQQEDSKKRGLVRRVVSTVFKPARTILGLRKRRHHD